MSIPERLRDIAHAMIDIADELDVEARVGGSTMADMKWSPRVMNVLNNERIETLGQLVRLTREEVVRMPNLGQLSLAEIEEKLAAIGLRLGGAIRVGSAPLAVKRGG